MYSCFAYLEQFLKELFAIVIDFLFDFVYLYAVSLIDFSLFLLEIVHFGALLRF